ncbi:MAG: MFS transporter [Actinomycetes bacterium]
MDIVRGSKYSDSEQSSPSAAPTPGTLGSAMQSKAFRRIFAGTFASNIGTWMQNITLIALAYRLTGSAWFTGVITFAQLGPMLFLSPFGGAIADRFNRRSVIISMSVVQLVMSMVLAVVALADTPNQFVLVVVVASIGCANAIAGPTMISLLPSLVPRQDLQPAIAINSVSLNASRVVGPLLGGLLGSLAGASAVFVVNGLTYLFVVIAVLSVDIDFSPKGDKGDGPIEQMRQGMRAVRADRVITRVIVSMAVLSMCSLIFIYQMPLVAQEHFGLAGWKFNLLFATFALGAALGALSMGSFLSGHNRAKVARVALVVFAVALAVFGTDTILPLGFVAAFTLGASYFVIVTALSTTLQMRAPDEVRGRIMGLWMMAWAGLVPLGALVGGPIIDAIGIAAVLIFGAVVAAALAVLIDLSEPEPESQTV